MTNRCYVSYFPRKQDLTLRENCLQCFLFFQESTIWHFLKIISTGNQILFSGKNKKTNSSAEIVPRVLSIERVLYRNRLSKFWVLVCDWQSQIYGIVYSDLCLHCGFVRKNTSGFQIFVIQTQQDYSYLAHLDWPSAVCITKACIYKVDPHWSPLLYSKTGFTGVYIIFYISAQKHRLWDSLEPPRQGRANEYPQSMFWAEIWEILVFIWKILVFFGGEIFYIFE